MKQLKASVKYSVRFKALRLFGVIITTDKLFRKTCIIENIKIKDIIEVEDDETTNPKTSKKN